MLSDSTFSFALQEIFAAMKESPMSEKDFADKLAKCIDDQIKTATVTVEAGIALDASGSMGSVKGATTAKGKGSVS
uniref:Uncharacterized protein n=1 Tax=uncultured Spirochaetaceae bacterium TaxID=201186 RepID=A0A650EPF3_9SPIO|nr:hypothetical protein Unknown280_0040 [uncultured Spirochaetaceae bacterium]